MHSPSIKDIDLIDFNYHTDIRHLQRQFSLYSNLMSYQQRSNLLAILMYDLYVFSIKLPGIFLGNIISTL